jgi:hypothetical protein
MTKDAMFSAELKHQIIFQHDESQTSGKVLQTNTCDMHDCLPAAHRNGQLQKRWKGYKQGFSCTSDRMICSSIMKLWP